MKNKESKFLTGAEVAVQACIDAGAVHMFGYPITPGTEVLTHWISRAEESNKLNYLQTEDEVTAGFAICGAVMAGTKSFTATAGPGTVLMQDAMSMADGMRLPFVVIVAQRGGPSSGTVIYSQQEVNLAIHGGNGEGLRIVYSPTDLSELYKLTRLAFNSAWKYRFPSVVLSDGFLLKTRQNVILDSDIVNVDAKPLVDESSVKNIRNIYTFEEELHSELQDHVSDFNSLTPEVVLSESYKIEDAEEIIIAHGIVAGAAKEAIDELREQGKSVGLFRPITLSPFPKEELNKLAEKVKRFFIVESSLGQLKDLVKQNLESSTKIDGLFRPAMGIESEEIVNSLLNS